MKKPLGLFFVAFAFAFARSSSCRDAHQESVAHCPLEPRTDGVFRVRRQGCLFGYVVDKSSAAKYYAGAWEPDDATLDALEHQLSKMEFAVPSSYGRHYVGRTDRDGEKVVQVVFFCDHDHDWHREVLDPSDGEPCLLRATYHLDSQTINPQWYVETDAGGAP